MIVSVIFHDGATDTYGGRSYTYRTELPLKQFEKVLCPTYKGLKKGLVTRVNVPETEIDPAWADRVKEIKERDLG